MDPLSWFWSPPCVRLCGTGGTQRQGDVPFCPTISESVLIQVLDPQKGLDSGCIAAYGWGLETAFLIPLLESAFCNFIDSSCLLCFLMSPTLLCCFHVLMISNKNKPIQLLLFLLSVGEAVFMDPTKEDDDERISGRATLYSTMTQADGGTDWSEI